MKKYITVFRKTLALKFTYNSNIFFLIFSFLNYPVVIITKHSISPIMFALTMLIGPILLVSPIFAFHWSLKRYDSSGN